MDKQQNTTENAQRIIEMFSDKQLIHEDKPRSEVHSRSINQLRQINIQNQEMENDKQFQKYVNILFKKGKERQELKKFQQNNSEQQSKYLQNLYYNYLLHRKYNDDEFKEIQQEAKETYYYNIF